MHSLSRFPELTSFSTIDLHPALDGCSLEKLLSVVNRQAVVERLQAVASTNWVVQVGVGFPCTIAIRQGGHVHTFVATAMSLDAFSSRGLQLALTGRELTAAGLPGGPAKRLVVPAAELSVAVRGLDGRWLPAGSRSPSKADRERLHLATQALAELCSPVACPRREPVGVSFSTGFAFGVHLQLLRDAAKSLRDFVTPGDLAEALGCSFLEAMDLVNQLVEAGWLEESRDVYYVGNEPWHALIEAGRGADSAFLELLAG